MGNWKRIAAVFLVLVQLFLLCGCTGLDKMRKNQAFIQGEDLQWQGATYRLLPPCDELYPDLDYEADVYATKPDVPVLLSLFYAEQLLIPSLDDVFLMSYSDDSVYCRADQYDQITKRIREDFQPALVLYTYNVFDPETYEYSEETYTLTDEQVEVLELITSTVEPETMGEGWSLDYDWSVLLEACSEDLLFRRCNLEIARVGRSYYLLLYTDTETLAFLVPSGCNEQMKQITQAYVTAWEDYYDPDTEDWL